MCLFVCGQSMWDRVSHGELWIAVVVVEHIALFFRALVDRFVPSQPSWLLAQKHNRELFLKYVMAPQKKLEDLGAEVRSFYIASFIQRAVCKMRDTCCKPTSRVARDCRLILNSLT